MFKSVTIQGDLRHSDDSGDECPAFTVTLRPEFGSSDGAPEKIFLQDEDGASFELTPSQLVAVLKAVEALDGPGWNSMEPIRHVMEGFRSSCE